MEHANDTHTSAEADAESLSDDILAALVAARNSLGATPDVPVDVSSNGSDDDYENLPLHQGDNNSEHPEALSTDKTAPPATDEASVSTPQTVRMPHYVLRAVRHHRGKLPILFGLIPLEPTRVSLPLPLSFDHYLEVEKLISYSRCCAPEINNDCYDVEAVRGWCYKVLETDQTLDTTNPMKNLARFLAMEISYLRTERSLCARSRKRLRDLIKPLRRDIRRIQADVRAVREDYVFQKGKLEEAVQIINVIDEDLAATHDKMRALEMAIGSDPTVNTSYVTDIESVF